jgi:hypothetical protein
MYIMKWHKELTDKRWQEFGTAKQILMIANELNRAENCVRKDDGDEARNALERTFELLDLTIGIMSRKNMVRELLRFREMLALQYTKRKKHAEEISGLQRILLSLNCEAYKLLHNFKDKE